MVYEETFIRFLHALTRHRQQPSKGYSPVAADEADPLHQVYQRSTVNALLEGVFDGDLTYEEVRRHGDFGLGTFNGLDGEMIAFDGAFFQIRADGKVYPVDDVQKTPFVTVLFFRPSATETIDIGMNFISFCQYMDELVGTTNVFYAIRIDGMFETIETRSVPRQVAPYPRLVDVAADQPVFRFENITGTIAGFRFPDFAQGFNVPGYHLHFLSDDRQAGGHVLDFYLQHGELAIDHTSNFQVELPRDGAFLSADLDEDHEEELRQAEG